MDHLQRDQHLRASVDGPGAGDAHRWQVGQGIAHLRPEGPVAGNARAHDVGADDVVEKDVGVGVDVGRTETLLEGGGTQGRRRRDSNRPGVTSPAVGCRQRVVDRIADLRVLGLRRDLDVEGLVVKTPVDREARIRDKAIDHIAFVRLARGGIEQVGLVLIGELEGDQLREEEKVLISRGDIEAMK